jgi:hypothetical protein
MFAVGCLLLIILPLAGVAIGAVVGGAHGVAWGAVIGGGAALIVCIASAWALVRLSRR